MGGRKEESMKYSRERKNQGPKPSYVISTSGKHFLLLLFYFWLHWVFVAACGLLIVVASLCCRAQALGTRASAAVARRLSSCGARASLLCGMWDLPGPRLEPMSPALAGGFLTTASPGKSWKMFSIFNSIIKHIP